MKGHDWKPVKVNGRKLETVALLPVCLCTDSGSESRQQRKMAAPKSLDILALFCAVGENVMLSIYLTQSVVCGGCEH